MPLLLFLGVYLFSGFSPVSTSFDSRWTVEMAMSLWRHGNLQLDDYDWEIDPPDYYRLECVDASGNVTRGGGERFRNDAHKHCDGHWYSRFPVGGPVLTAPLIWGVVGVLNLLKPVLALIHTSKPGMAAVLRGDYDAGHSIIEMEVASALLGVATALIYLTARRFVPVRKAAILSLLFAVATPAYSVAGRALWQHTPSMLLLALIVYMLVSAEERPSLAGWVGIPVALSYTVRPTDSLFVLLFTGYVAVRHRHYLLRYLLGAAPIALAFVAYNSSIYRALFPPYYSVNFLSGFVPSNWPRFAEALVGNLISPSRGLFVYTPVFLFSVWSMVSGAWKTPIAPWLAVLVLAHWIVVSAWVKVWWAGQCYGPRFFTDVTPVLVLFLIPYFRGWEKLSRGLRVAFVALSLVGFAMHLRGGWSTAVYQWNIDPVSVDQHPERKWQWSDPPFLR